MSVPGLRPVTVVRRVRQRDDDGAWTRDARGDAVYEEAREVIPDCLVQVSSTREQTDGFRHRVTTTASIVAPSSWPAGAIDAVEFDDLQWEVEGRPLRRSHPRMGHVRVEVREASG